MNTIVEYLSYDLHVDITKGTAFSRSRLGDGSLRTATPEEMERAAKIAGNAKARQESLVTDVAERTGRRVASFGWLMRQTGHKPCHVLCVFSPD